MAKNEVSHDPNTPGPRISQGYHPINLRGPVPKRDGPWECSGRVKPPLGTEEKGKRFCPVLGVFPPLYWEKLHKGITKVITTTETIAEAIIIQSEVGSSDHQTEHTRGT